MLVGFGAGGGTDILARIVAPAMGTALGQPVVIENRPGAGGSIAANQVAKSAPDGYTAFMLNNGHAVSAVMISPLPYDPVADFQPVSMVATMPLFILAGPRAGFGSLQGLIEVARLNPGKLNLASVGIGSTQHFAAELFFETAGIKLVHVPYKGTPNAIAATTSNETQLLVEVAAPVIGQIRGGVLNALAVTSGTRFPGLPDVPTVGGGRAAGLRRDDLVRAGVPGEDAGRHRGKNARRAAHRACARGRAQADAERRVPGERKHTGGARGAHEVRDRALGRRARQGRHQAGVTT